MRIAALLVLLSTAGCVGARPLEGLDELESARTYFEMQRYEEALELAEAVLDQSEDDDDEVLGPSPAQRGEAAFLAAESALAEGLHLRAFRHYRTVLESSPWSPHAAEIEERLFDIGLTFLYDDEYGGWFDSRARGVEVLETLQVHFRRSDLADDALRHVGDYFAGEEVREWVEGAISYEKLYREYPDSEWAERSLWLAGHCRLRAVPGPEYNREELLRAKDLLELSLRVHAKGVKADDVRADLAEVREYLAQGEILVANFYAGRGVTFGEQLRLANAALAFPDTVAGRQALERLAAYGLSPPELAGPSRSSLDALKARPGREDEESARSEERRP